MYKSNTGKKLLEFANVTVRRGNVNALDGISLEIGIDENVAIIGPNGSGKSTLIKTITRECYPQADSEEPNVKILGESVWDVHYLRSMLGIVSSDLQQVCDRRITGKDTVMSGFFSSIGVYPHQYITPKMEEAVNKSMELLEVTELANRFMIDMSTGQARRMLIARAMVHNPLALILDEPTSALDPYAARKFMVTLGKIAHNGQSIIMVTHHLHNITPETERVIMIKDGKIFADGAKSKIINEKLLSELFSMQVSVTQKNGYYYMLA